EALRRRDAGAEGEAAPDVPAPQERRHVGGYQAQAPAVRPRATTGMRRPADRPGASASLVRVRLDGSADRPGVFWGRAARVRRPRCRPSEFADPPERPCPVASLRPDRVRVARRGGGVLHRRSARRIAARTAANVVIARRRAANRTVAAYRDAERLHLTPCRERAGSSAHDAAVARGVAGCARRRRDATPGWS